VKEESFKEDSFPMPFDPISPPAESLVAESADVQTISEYFSTELADILVDEQCNASVIARIQALIAVADTLANAFS
jgi:hypothetical protein